MDTLKWRHKRCRSTKRDGVPVFDGRKWNCSRCGTGYVVNDSATQEEAEEMFRRYLARVSFEQVE